MPNPEGLSAEDLEAEQALALPEREAMSKIGVGRTAPPLARLRWLAAQSEEDLGENLLVHEKTVVPGELLAGCHIPGHYAAGIRADISVG